MHEHMPELLVKAANPVMVGGIATAVGAQAGTIFGLAPAEWTFIFGAIGAFCAVVGTLAKLWLWFGKK